jgi:Tfp pilus assembly protein PilF
VATPPPAPACRAFGWTLLLVAGVAMAARTWVRNADWHDEHALFSSGARVRPNSLKTLNNWGNLLMKARTVDANVAAEEMLRRSIALYPHHAPAYHNLGLVLMQREGGAASGVNAFWHALFLDYPAPGRCAKDLAQVILAERSTTAKGELPEWLVTASAPWLEQYWQRNAERHQGGDPTALDLARLLAEDATQWGCRDADLYVVRGHVALDLGAHDAAVRCVWSRGGVARARRPPRSPRSRSLFRARARSELTTALRILNGTEPAEIAKAQNLLALTHQAAGHVSTAVAAWEAALALTPHDASMRSNLGNALARLGRHEDAVIEHQRAAELAPKHGLVLNNLGFALEAVGRWDDAMAAYEVAARLTTHPQVETNIAKLRQRLASGV